MFVKAFEDYMQGPSFIRSNDPEILHSQIFQSSKGHESQTIVANPISSSENYQFTKTGKVQKILSLLTLNGHFLPKFLISDESVTMREVHITTIRDEASTPIKDTLNKQKRDSVCKGFAKKRIIFTQEKLPLSYQNELDQKAGMNILFAWLKSLITSRLRWSTVNAEWKKAAKDLTSIEFWQDYLETQKKDQVSISK